MASPFILIMAVETAMVSALVSAGSLATCGDRAAARSTSEMSPR